MYRRTIFTLTTMALLGLAVTLPAGDAAAQQKQKVSYQTTAANTKYTQQHAIDVEDVPGHILRVYEIHRTYPNNPPVINGVALKEQFTRGTSDQTDNNGVSINHSTYVLVNGDKFFTRGTTVAQNNGPGKSSNSSTAYIVGGTGKLAGIQGVTRGKGASEPKAGINENHNCLIPHGPHCDLSKTHPALLWLGGTLHVVRLKGGPGRLKAL